MKVRKHFLVIQYGCGMQPVVVYSLNHDTTMSFGLHLTPIFQNLAPTCTGITVQGCTHMPILSICRCLNTFHPSNMDVGCSQWSFRASTMTSQHIGLHLTPILQDLAPTCTGITVKRCTHMPIHTILWHSSILYICRYMLHDQSLSQIHTIPK